MAIAPLFPPIPPQIPRCLKALSLRHQLLVAYWIYCCPDRLKLYLYQADSEYYMKATGMGLFRSLKMPAYRALYCCIPFSILCLSLSLSLPVLLLWQGPSLNWLQWLWGIVLGDSVGLLFGFAFGLIFGFSSNTAKGASWGVTIGLITGVANAVGLSILLGAFPVESFKQLLEINNLSSVTLFALALGTPLSLMIGGPLGSIVGLTTGLAAGLVSSLVFSIVQTAIVNVVASCMIYAAMVGLASTGTFGAATNMARCILLCVAVSIAVGLSVDYFSIQQQGLSWSTGLTYGGVAMFLVWLGAFRLFPASAIYWVYLTLKAIPFLPLSAHPLDWDELLILPLPGSQRYVDHLLERNPKQGIELIFKLFKNPFQRALAQRSLKRHLEQSPTPLFYFYRILQQPAAQAYLFPPLEPQDWDQVPTVQAVMVAELNGQWKNSPTDSASRLFESLVYGLTWLHRDHEMGRLSGVYQLLYALISREELAKQTLALSRFVYVDADLFRTDATSTRLGHRSEALVLPQPSWNAARSLPSEEDCLQEQIIQQSLRAIADFVRFTKLTEIAEVAQNSAYDFSSSVTTRIDVIQTLISLQDVAKEAAIAVNSQSQLVRQAALLRANGLLEELANEQLHPLVSPEQDLLRAVIRNWSHGITEAGTVAGQLIQPNQCISNPYVTGTPVTGKLFVGREDILRRLAEELSLGSGPCSSIVLYGHRRMGKSSILKELPSRLKSNNLRVVPFNMQVLGHVKNTGELLYALARQITRSLSPKEHRQVQAQLPISQAAVVDEERTRMLRSPRILKDWPSRATFLVENPYHALDQFFQTLTTQLPNQRFVIAIDEFEKIEEKIEARELSLDLLEFLRGVTQTYSCISLIFAGLHTLEEMCHSYWHPFFTSVPIRVSFLSAAAARQLILFPAQVGYEDAAVADIIRLTQGQPYLLQLIGHRLITDLNRQQRRLLNTSEIPVFTQQDVHNVLSSPEFYSAGSAYFRGIWLQAKQSPIPGQIELLQKLAAQAPQAPGGSLKIQKLVETTRQVSALSYVQVQIALQTLVRHDVLETQGDRCSFRVELMRRWVMQHG